MILNSAGNFTGIRDSITASYPFPYGSLRQMKFPPWFLLISFKCLIFQLLILYLSNAKCFLDIFVIDPIFGEQISVSLHPHKREACYIPRENSHVGDKEEENVELPDSQLSAVMDQDQPNLQNCRWEWEIFFYGMISPLALGRQKHKGAPRYVQRQVLKYTGKDDYINLDDTKSYEEEDGGSQKVLVCLPCQIPA